MLTEPLGALVVDGSLGGLPPDEWMDWYDTEHLPHRLSLDGWLSGQRWSSEDGRRFVCMYDLASIDVLDRPDPGTLMGSGHTAWARRIRRLRSTVGDPTLDYRCVQWRPGSVTAPDDCPFLYFARMNVAAEVEDDFNRWYDEEHLPRLADVPGVRCARRFLASNHDHRRVKYLATYHLEEADIIRSVEWKAALRTPWSRRMAPSLQDVSLCSFRR